MHFGPIDGTDSFESIDVLDRSVGIRPIATQTAKEEIKPEVSDAAAVYRDAWPETDLHEVVTSDSVEESIILKNRQAAAHYSFKVEGATVHENTNGSLDLRRGGQTLGTIHAPTIATSAPSSKHNLKVSTQRPSGSPGITASGVHYRVAGDTISVEISRSWLTGVSESAFPIVIDPSFVPATPSRASQAKSFSTSGGTSNGSVVVGQAGTGPSWDGAAYIATPATPTRALGQQGWQMTDAELSATCASHICPMEYGEITGLNSLPTNWSGVLNGELLAQNLTGAPANVISGPVTRWFVAHPSGSWFGFYAQGIDTSEQTGNQSYASVTLPEANIYASFVYYQEPAAPQLISPTQGSVVATSTPTFTASTTDTEMCKYDSPLPTSDGVMCDQPQNVTYDFKVTQTEFGYADGQIVADSGWIQQPFTLGADSGPEGHEVRTSDPTWAVPPGSLVDGATYWVSVQAADSNQNPEATGPEVIAPPANPRTPTEITVKLRAGGGGPSSMDSVGAAPGQTSTPSQGSPSPGAATATESVNLTTGNLVLSAQTPHMTTLAGPAGVTLTYNSIGSSIDTGSQYGLTASYYLDTGNHSYPSTSVGTAVTPSIDTVSDSFTRTQPPIGGLPALTPYLAKWLGTVTVPTGTWQLGGLASGGMRIYLDGSSTPIFDDWDGTRKSLSFGSGVAGGAHQIEVDAWDPAQATQIQLWANNLTDPTSPVPSVVPSSWLNPHANGLPVGWTLGTGATAQWTSISDMGEIVVLRSPLGATEAFVPNGDGTYTPASGGNDSLSLADGAFQLNTTDGYMYRFSTGGELLAMSTVADDLHPTALQYAYGPESATTGSPLVLQEIRDPVSNRTIDLSYGASSACAVPNAFALLCAVKYWDGTHTSFTYNANAELAEVDNPGNSDTVYGYDSDNRLDDIRDSLANDEISAGEISGEDCSNENRQCAFDTWISYDSMGRVSSILEPQTGTKPDRASRSYVYSSSSTSAGAGSTSVSIGGYDPSSGYDEKVDHDAEGRISAQLSADGTTNYVTWDSQDRPIMSVRDGEQTSQVYDEESNVTDKYGPAPVACFDAASMPSGVTANGPAIGYRPLADSSSAEGCGVVVPHATNTYDEGLSGLAAEYWPNGAESGSPVLHTTGVDAPASACQESSADSNSTSLCAKWPSGSTPANIGTDTDHQWSMRLTGTISLPSSGQWMMCVFNSSNLNLTVDIDGSLETTTDAYVTPDSANEGYYHGPPPASIAENNTQFSGWLSPSCGYGFEEDPIYRSLSAGVHSISVDLQESSASTTGFDVMLLAPGSSTLAEVPLSSLSPGYGLSTSAVDPDGLRTRTTYSAENLGPEYGLPTAETAGAGTGAATTTTTTYEPPSAGYLRRTSSTLPSGATTTYDYYSGIGGPVAAVCGVSSDTPQGGQVEAETEPGANGGAGREQQFVYDAAGRQVGRRVGPAASITSALWQCTAYDSRGRVTSVTIPANATSAARTVSYGYNVGGNPATSSVSDGSGTISSTVDLLGRPVSYTDASGTTTATMYTRSGLVAGTAGPQGTIVPLINSETSKVDATYVNGTRVASMTYSGPGGQLSGVLYGNGDSAAISYDAFQREDEVLFNDDSSGGFISGEKISRSAAGRIVTDLQDVDGTQLTNPNPAGVDAPDYVYDGSGRLVSAYESDGLAVFGYGTNSPSEGCVNSSQGADTNRTSVTIHHISGSSSTTDYCYNMANQLVSSMTGSRVSSNYAYDGRGNQTEDDGMSLTWDSSGRLATTTTASGMTTTYSYDAVDRVTRVQSGSDVVQYVYAGYSDVASEAIAGTTRMLQVPLAGGVVLSLANVSSNDVWSFSDLKGNLVASADDSGAVIGSPATYDPWGRLISGQAPSNTGGTDQLGANGAFGKTTDSSSGLIMLGARALNPSEGRFMTVDPVEGGCANPYTYSFGDPINHPDLTGRDGCDSSGLLAGMISITLGITSMAIAVSVGAEAVPLLVALGATGLLAGAYATYTDRSCMQGNDDACPGFILGAAGTVLSLPSLAPGLPDIVGLPASAAGISLGTAGTIADLVSGYGSAVCSVEGVIHDIGTGIGDLIGGVAGFLGNLF
ncbi:RHS repeat-associated core domain-containing protein [Nocardioides sp. BP30]|uniref:RHS repeat-associated core domain-containing protein n=1 Tax=Nocardioides sp. BP30 TaxID=3036374 RepID=UPI002468B9ED|nr:RHS repeat-associated core domain-containing protein [Nocardioides sp. BP30]WGL52978.1 RHS repeat-associated core domain-containing protein [Nocardioides sp. BP30]